MHVIIRKSNAEILETGVRYPELTEDQATSAMVDRYGGTKSDYSVFFSLDKTIIDRVQNADQFDLVRDAGGALTGLNFSSEDAKPWIKIVVDKEIMLNDGIDGVAITVEVWRSNLSSIMTGFNRAGMRMQVSTPNGERFVRLDIVNGVARKTLRTRVSGRWIFPAEPTRQGNVRNLNRVEIIVDDGDILQ